MASQYHDELNVSFSGGSNRVLMMDNGMVSDEEADISVSESQPLLQQRYVEKKEGKSSFSSLVCCIILFSTIVFIARRKKLGMIFGVTLPCILSIFSVILFLRLGMVVGQVRCRYDTMFLEAINSLNCLLYKLITETLL